MLELLRSSCGCGCGGLPEEVSVELICLDLESCDRCSGTARALREALRQVGLVLADLGVRLSLREVVVGSEEEAQALGLVSSPTIRVNGRDLQGRLLESRCPSCSDICGSSVDCRVFEFDGDLYEVPPPEVLAKAILEAALGPSAGEERPRSLPDNLRRFFEGKRYRFGESFSRRPMRREEREIKDEAELRAILSRNRVLRLGMAVEGFPYVVPMTYAYDGKFLIMHSAPEGLKLEILRVNPRVCFEVEEGVELSEADDPCGWSVRYTSLIGFGRAELVEDPEEKRALLGSYFSLVSGRRWEVPPKLDLSGVAVIRVLVEVLRGKRNG